MIKVPNTFQHRSFEKKLKEQHKLGYPNFKKAIAESLSEDYNVALDEALRLTSSPEFDKEIMSDIAWAQHMGTEYWAEVIYDNYY